MSQSLKNSEGKLSKHYVCVCMCMHVYMYECVYVLFMCACMYVCLCACFYVCMYVWCMYTYVWCMYVYMYGVCMYGVYMLTGCWTANTCTFLTGNFSLTFLTSVVELCILILPSHNTTKSFRWCEYCICFTSLWLRRFFIARKESYIHIHIHTHTYTYIHTYIHTYIYLYLNDFFVLISIGLHSIHYDIAIRCTNKQIFFCTRSVWVYECMSIWVYEYMSVWVYEYIWVYE